MLSEETPNETNPKESIMKTIIENKLTEGITLRVTFTKKDGTERVMTCTKNMEKIPVEHHPKGTGKPRTSDAIAVFDLDNNGWRSFSPSSVLAVESIYN
jgi:hypothetical protein